MEAGGFEHRPDMAERIDEFPIGLAIDRRAACGWLDEAEQHSQGSGLARAVRSEEPRDAALCNLEAEIVDSDDISESFGQAVYLDGCHDATVRWWRRYHIAIETGSRLRPQIGMSRPISVAWGMRPRPSSITIDPWERALDLAKRTQALVRRYPWQPTPCWPSPWPRRPSSHSRPPMASCPRMTPHTAMDGRSPSWSRCWPSLSRWRGDGDFRSPSAVVVVVAFLVARIVVHVPEANISLFVLWLMIYSVAVHGQRRFRTPVLASLLQRHRGRARTRDLLR